MLKVFTSLLILSIIITGCDMNDKNDSGLYPCEEARAFADQNYDENIYRFYEFDLARMPAWGDSGAYSGDLYSWTAESWDTKISYLPRQGFTHELPTQEAREVNSEIDEQYYIMIGRYIHQFGVGWADTPAWDPNNPDNDVYKPYFDGISPLRDEYIEMW
ncbi:hypothetical protein K9N50_06415 [bacterium]|nr:hypothetical protein [bacterium]